MHGCRQLEVITYLQLSSHQFRLSLVSILHKELYSIWIPGALHISTKCRDLCFSWKTIHPTDASSMLNGPLSYICVCIVDVKVQMQGGLALTSQPSQHKRQNPHLTRTLLTRQRMKKPTTAATVYCRPHLGVTLGDSRVI